MLRRSLHIKNYQVSISTSRVLCGMLQDVNEGSAVK